jgi:hypothetical protein
LTPISHPDLHRLSNNRAAPDERHLVAARPTAKGEHNGRSIAQVAEAAAGASEPIDSGTVVVSGGTAARRIFNAETGTAPISRQQIFTNGGGLSSLFDGIWKTGLGAGNSGRFDSAIPGNFAIAYRIALSATGASLRGTTKIRSLATTS